MRGLDLDVRFRDAKPEDAHALARLGRDTFVETFVDAYRKTDLDTFLQSTFAAEIQAAEIAEPRNDIRLAEARGGLVGYAMVGPVKLPIDPAPTAALELHRIYVRGDRQGVGLGRILLSWTVQRARERGAEDLYLGVWTNNVKAIAVYETRGFERVGHYDFHVGAQIDYELIMRKTLAG